MSAGDVFLMVPRQVAQVAARRDHARLPPNNAQFRPTTNIEPRPTSVDAGDQCNCKASGATALLWLNRL